MNSMDRILTEAMVRKAIADMADAPARSARNLVELGLFFTRSSFQKMFLTRLHDILRNEASPYYRLLQDTVQHVDQERLLTFSMNLGYNSCTHGSKIIRQIEQAQQFDIPWSVFLELRQAANLTALYSPIIDQGKALGIYTWFLHSARHHTAPLALAAAHPDCAFILFLDADEIDDSFLAQAQPLAQLLPVVRSGPGAAEACRLLRQHRLLYALSLTYHSDDVPSLLDGTFFRQAELLHPAFTAVVAADDCSDVQRQRVYHALREAREAQHFCTIPWDCVYDTCSIDSVISQDACSAGFNADGQLISLYHLYPQPTCNLFRHSLRDILHCHFPKAPHSEA